MSLSAPVFVWHFPACKEFLSIPVEVEIIENKFWKIVLDLSRPLNMDRLELDIGVLVEKEL